MSTGNGSQRAQACGNVQCDCTHTDGCDHGWMNAVPRQVTRAHALPDSDLPLHVDKQGKWRTRRGVLVAEARIASGEMTSHERVRRCPRCKMWDGVTA